MLRPIVDKRKSFPMELDKIPGFWTATGWVGDVVLRLRVDLLSTFDPCELSCEIRLRDEPEFRLLTTQRTCLLPLVTEGACCRKIIEGLPQIYTDEFQEMAWRCAVSGWFVDFGDPSSTRYAAEPVSSRDCFAFDESGSKRDL